VAAGAPLGVRQDDVRMTGHALECRINAEAPEAAFRPCPGVVAEWVVPAGAGIRVDTHVEPGTRVPPFYDSLLAKLVVHAEDRAAAIARLGRALDAFHAAGIATTLAFHRAIAGHPDFRAGRVHTRWVEDELLPRASGGADGVGASAAAPGAVGR
jgi:acetyl-CoA carboxylase biotin carboxylase subunit